MIYGKDSVSLFIFDLETVPDVSVVSNLCGREEGFLIDKAREYYTSSFLQSASSTEVSRRKLIDYHLQITAGKNSFPRQLFHQIACISFVVADVVYLDDGSEAYRLRAVRSGGEPESTEEEIIRGCVNYLGKKPHRLVTFNGRTFDIPVLKYRALKYGISIPWLYKGDTDKRSPSYNYRYNVEWNCDLLDVLSDFGASAIIKLREVCALLDIPCKYDVDGSGVTDLYDQNKINEIRDYCEIDALITYIIYLRHRVHVARMSLTSYNEAIQDIINYIENNRDRKNLSHFLSLWAQISQGNYGFIR